MTQSAPLPAAPLLDVSGLTVSYGAVEAVRGIALSVRKGEIVTLLGANGAGKSSTSTPWSAWRRVGHSGWPLPGRTSRSCRPN